MTQADLLEIEKSSKGLMEHLGDLLFTHGAILDNVVVKLSILTVLHKDIDSIVFPNDFVDLGNVLVQ